MIDCIINCPNHAASLAPDWCCSNTSEPSLLIVSARRSFCRRQFHELPCRLETSAFIGPSRSVLPQRLSMSRSMAYAYLCHVVTKACHFEITILRRPATNKALLHIYVVSHCERLVLLHPSSHLRVAAVVARAVGIPVVADAVTLPFRTKAISRVSASSSTFHPTPWNQQKYAVSVDVQLPVRCWHIRT